MKQYRNWKSEKNEMKYFNFLGLSMDIKEHLGQGNINLMCSTEFYDKKGVRIYEGDIILYQFGKDYFKKTELIIGRHEDRWFFIGDRTRYEIDDNFFKKNKNDMEVIGNIYEGILKIGQSKQKNIKEDDLDIGINCLDITGIPFVLYRDKKNRRL